MNPKNNESQNTKGDDKSFCFFDESSSLVPAVVEAPETTGSSACPDMKRSAVKDLIERYFYQLQRGCGNPKCTNHNCASSGRVSAMTPNEIAARAIQLFSQDATLCDTQTTRQLPKMPQSTNDSSTSAGATHSMEVLSPSHENSTSSSSSGNSTITSGSSQRSKSSSSTSSSSSTTTTTNTTEETPLPAELGNTDDRGGFSGVEEFNNPATQQQFSSLAQSQSPSDESIHHIHNVPSCATTSTAIVSQIGYLDEQILDELLDECHQHNNYDRLLAAINEVYPNVEKLSRSYRRRAAEKSKAPTGESSQQRNSKLQEILGKSPSDLKKEDLRTLEGENDKDEDSTCPVEGRAYATGGAPNNDGDGTAAHNAMAAMEHDDSQPRDCVEPMDEDETTGATLRNCPVDLAADSSDTCVDLESLRRVKKKLFHLNNKAIGEALNNNIILLAEGIRYSRITNWEQVLHCLVICFDMATNTSNQFADLEYLERSLPKLCHAARSLPIVAQARMARIWAAHCRDQLHSLVQCFQQLISLQVMLDEDSIQENTDVIAVTKVLKIAYFANLLAGQLEKPQHTFQQAEDASSGDVAGARASGNASGSVADDDDLFFYTQVPKTHYSKFAEDRLEKELNVSSMNCRQPLVPFEEFYNEPLSDAIQMDRDYLAYRNMSLDPSNEDIHFSFMLYSFILTPATKVIALYYDSRIRMYSERNSSLYSLLNNFAENDGTARPDLKLKVRREKIIDDALIGLELVALNNPKDLKKQLVVEFVGEEGIDEGGVSKEFFQLIVEEIFNPDYGMFTQQEDTNTVWFNSSPFENEAQFTLVGIILGLAIYNNIILAVNFPMIVYRKLMGAQGTFFDLEDWHPTLYRSLKSLLDYVDSDMETVFMQTFKINYMNVFGEMMEYDLKGDGGDIFVGQHNKQEFVELYSDFLLNRNVERQFRAFKKGFEMVTDESPLKLLFRPEEVELLVCGSRNYDFVELERSTEYEGGYTKDTPIIKDFWAIMHSMPEDSKRKLIEFTTGSDRVPVGGLSRLKLLITRHGPDSDRLPTSHTCFNVLLLPEYNSKDKLEERLLKAINYSKGFGML